MSLFRKYVEAISITPPSGDVRTVSQIYQDQVAQTIANLLGLDFKANHSVDLSITFILSK